MGSNGYLPHERCSQVAALRGQAFPQISWRARQDSNPRPAA